MLILYCSVPQNKPLVYLFVVLFKQAAIMGDTRLEASASLTGGVAIILVTANPWVAVAAIAGLTIFAVAAVVVPKANKN